MFHLSNHNYNLWQLYTPLDPNLTLDYFPPRNHIQEVRSLYTHVTFIY